MVKISIPFGASNSSWILEKNRVQMEGEDPGSWNSKAIDFTFKNWSRFLMADKWKYFLMTPSATKPPRFLNKNSLPPQNYIYINIGASGAHRRWPEDRFLALAEKILQQTNYKIILGGGPGEKQHIRRYAGKTGPGPML